MYRRFFKHGIDVFIAIVALLIFSPVLIILSVVGIFAMRGNPFFIQRRPGKGEKIFKLIKFRTMTNEKDKQGNLLPDAVRLHRYGKFLRSTSLDELPELINVINGTMSLVGPRPLLVRDMVFMTKKQRRRHRVRQGITGLAQVSGRNNITWEEKLEYDLKYIQKITFMGDVKIILRTVMKVLKREDTVREGTVSDMDFGDYLLDKGEIEIQQYRKLQDKAKKLMGV